MSALQLGKKKFLWDEVNLLGGTFIKVLKLDQLD